MTRPQRSDLVTETTSTSVHSMNRRTGMRSRRGFEAAADLFHRHSLLDVADLAGLLGVRIVCGRSVFGRVRALDRVNRRNEGRLETGVGERCRGGDLCSWHADDHALCTDSGLFLGRGGRPTSRAACRDERDEGSSSGSRAGASHPSWTVANSGGMNPLERGDRRTCLRAIAHRPIRAD